MSTRSRDKRAKQAAARRSPATTRNESFKNTRQAVQIKTVTRQVAPDLDAVIYTPQNGNGTRDMRPSNIAPDVSQLAAPKPEKDRVRRISEPTRLQLEREKRCKQKPASNRGKGGSRPFVPWCKK